jgi:SAM-dependent methyltransferase
VNLTERDAHFEFGQNWRDYAKTIDGARIESAVQGLNKLFPQGLSGKTFLDIGCGSGLHSLAALMLGASSVLATDLDENSVSTTRAVLSQNFSDTTRWTAKAISVFDMTPETTGQFDVVYSWGVLHHTGDMWRAIERAGKLAKPSGQFALAIYAKTTFDPVWKIEKRIYSGSPKAGQWIIRQGYLAALFSAYALRGRNPLSLFSKARVRGMNFLHDVHDWLGGFPYETASAEELRDRICALGFTEERSFPIAPTMGVFSSGCHEFVFRRAVLTQAL